MWSSWKGPTHLPWAPLLKVQWLVKPRVRDQSWRSLAPALPFFFHETSHGTQASFSANQSLILPALVMLVSWWSSIVYQGFICWSWVFLVCKCWLVSKGLIVLLVVGLETRKDDGQSDAVFPVLFTDIFFRRFVSTRRLDSYTSPRGRFQNKFLPNVFQQCRFN